MKPRPRLRIITIMKLSMFYFLAQGLAAPTTQDLGRPERIRSWMSGETAMILGLAGLVGLALFAWAFFFRRRRPSDPHRRVIEAGAMTDGGNPAREERSRHGHRRHRRRHRHSGHNHRNPTLQEAGGLPLPRPDDQPPAF
jgi:hypothetical protein